MLIIKNTLKATILIVIIAVLTACSRDPIDTTEFQSIMTDENFDVIDATYQLDEVDIVLVLLAMSETYQIQLTEFTTISAADDSFLYFRDYAENVLRNGNDTLRSSDGSNFSSYSLTTSDVYFNLLRIDNIVILTEAPSEYRDEIRDVMGLLN